MVQELLDSELLVQQQEAEAGKAGCSLSAITNEAGGGCSARRNLNAPFTELRRTGQEAPKTELFEARAARHYACHHAGPAGRNLTDLNLPVQRANYVCSENSFLSFSLSLNKLLDCGASLSDPVRFNLCATNASVTVSFGERHR